MRRHAIAFVSGILFAGGLALSGMTRPGKVIGFLDVSGHWDPSLAFVMVGAIAIYATIFWTSRRMTKPLLAEVFAEPAAARIDRRLLLGSAIFGIGWGLAGYCPGPALASLGAGMAQAVYFVVSMTAGMGLARMVDRLAGRMRKPVTPRGAQLG
jgi:uncharacterized membrane protein YedE/YeeE